MATVSSTSTTSGTSSTSGTSGTTASTAVNKTSLDYDAFLKLLLAQLKNQDPTKPMDSTEYMSQLASFSNVEQSVNMNRKLDDIITLQALSQAETMVGKTVSNSDGSITGKVTAVDFTKDGPIATLDNKKTLHISQVSKIAA